mgnify:CR=1 FL=1
MQPFDPYVMHMRNHIETNQLRLRLAEEMRADTPRYRRAVRFAQLIQYLLGDFLPRDRDCRRCIEDHLLEAAFAGNCEIINVPPECDELDKLALERRMLELRTKPITFPIELKP